MKQPSMRWLVMAALLCAACGDDDGGATDARAVGDTPPAAAEGQVAVHEVAVGEDLAFRGEALGSIVDVRPDFYQLADSGGDCRFYRHEPSFCGDCFGVCSPEGVCEPFPENLHAGSLHIDGTSEPITLAEDYGYRPSAALPSDLFAPGDPVSLTADGGADVPAFSLAATGTAPIWIDLSEGDSSETGSSPGDNTLALDDTRDLALSWSDPVAGARVRLEIRGSNQAHGQPLDALIVCEADDTGALAVPRSMVEAFPPRSYHSICDGSDCPMSVLVRLTRDRREVDGRVMELEVGARRDFVVVH